MPYSIMGHLQTLDSTELNKIFPTQHRTDMAEEKKWLIIHYTEFTFSQVIEIATTLLHVKRTPAQMNCHHQKHDMRAQQQELQMLKDLYVLINFSLATIITLI